MPSWNEGTPKKAIIAFVQATTDASSPHFVPPGERIATFDQDGTTWVEQPMYPVMLFGLARLRQLAQDKPELRSTEPFKSILSGGPAALGKLSPADIETVMGVALSGMSVGEYEREVKAWLETARDPRFKRPYDELAYQPMLEVMQYLRANGYKTYFVTGGEQDFVRAYAGRTYGIPPEQVVGSIGAVSFGYDAKGAPTLTKQPRFVLNNDGPGKPEGIHMLIGRRPGAAFGNSSGDREMLEYTKAGEGARLAMLVHHDDGAREYAYGAQSTIGTFSDELMAEASQKGWVVISMKNDWKRIFPWEQP